jgi:hypothetical protein
VSRRYQLVPSPTCVVPVTRVRNGL